MDKTFSKAFEYKVIYVFGIRDDLHKGYLKIGDATLHTNTPIDKLGPNTKELNQASLERIKSYTNTAGLTPELKHTELAIKHDKEKGLVAFRDYQVQAVLKNSGNPCVKLGDSTGIEWFDVDLETAKKAIEAVKNGYANLSNTPTEKHIPIIFRPEQSECIKKVCEHFKVADRFLINAKMRYGKTLVTLEIVKRCGFKKTIILTHRPVVDAGWYDDFKKIFYETDYCYGSKGTGYSLDVLLSLGKPFIYFASIQDLRGSKLVGGLFDKNDLVFSTVWDCMIVDEAHEGTTTALGEETVKAVFKEEEHKTKLLALSGTPFNIIAHYDDDSIYTWDYVMEQECKSDWDKYHFGDSNPYDELPQLRIYTYSLGELLDNKGLIFEDKAFNFAEFFRTFTGDIEIDHEPMPEDRKEGDFVHEDDIWSFLNLMVKDDGESQYPFSTEEYREIFKHTLWMVPGVREARALKKLMMKHPVFGNGSFDIVNVAGSEDEEEKTEEALKKVKNALASAKKTGRYTITLSCGKLTTGVTIKEWTGVFMLAGSYSTSAANYLQTIFRVQSPCNEDGKIKETAYVFDFAPDRTLKMVSKAASINTKKGKSKIGDKVVLGKFLNYMPVISIQGSEMEEYSATRLLQQIKDAYVEKVVSSGFEDNSLYNDELLKLTDVDIQAFNELKDIIGKDKANKKTSDIKVNEQGLTDEEYEEQERIKNKPKKKRTQEEESKLKELQEKNKLRQTAMAILRGISVRMPMLIYGADVDYDNDISLDSFVDMVDEESWKEFMPSGVTKEKFKEFQKYYDEEVFIAAGRKIRYTAKEADKLSPDERVKKIASLFSCFKNPDKETVLTPWRVVNLHMSETLGGWDFFDEKHEGTIEKPRFVDRGDITKKVFGDPDTHVLEINSKTGLYPLYVAYSIYRYRLYGSESDEQKRAIWKQVLDENVFVICKTPMAKAITKRTLAGYSGARINAHCFDDLINTLKSKSKQFAEKVLRPNFWGKEGNEMKISAVVGNPPYQEDNLSNNKKTAIYHLFYNGAMSVSDIVTLISPARFLFNGGLTPKEWNKAMLSNEHIEVVLYEENASSIFPNTDIKGGVAILLYDKNRKLGPVDEFIPDEMEHSIARHFSLNEKKSLASIIYSGRSDLKFTDEFLAEYPQTISDRIKAIQKKNPEVTQLAQNEEYEIKSSSFDVLPYVFLNEKPNLNQRQYIEIIGLEKAQRTIKWIERKYVTPRYPNDNNIDKYKLLVPESNGTGTMGEPLSTPIVVGPCVSSTPTFISVGKFSTEEEACACLKYIKTKLTRFLLGILKKTQHNPASVWKYVPLQDFTNQSDIDWKRPISDIDQQLYKKYKLTSEEIDYIEEKVVPMD